MDALLPAACRQVADFRLWVTGSSAALRNFMSVYVVTASREGAWPQADSMVESRRRYRRLATAGNLVDSVLGSLLST